MPDGLEPPPPGGLRDYTPHPRETYVLPAQSRLWRLYKRQLHNTNWNTFRNFGPTDSRFDHHLPPKGVQERSILYAAEDWDTCVAEVFQEQRLVDTHKDEPRLVAFTFTSDIRLLDLAGPWPIRAGASMAINSGDRKTARAWSQAVYEAFPDIQGLRYASAMNEGKVSYAFYERARPVLAESPAIDLPLDRPELTVDLELLTLRLGYDLV